MSQGTISGYRPLSKEEIDLVNEIKARGDALGAAVDLVGQLEGVDQRALAIARTHLQTGLMWLVRAVTKPTGF